MLSRACSVPARAWGVVISVQYSELLEGPGMYFLGSAVTDLAPGISPMSSVFNVRSKRWRLGTCSTHANQGISTVATIHVQGQTIVPAVGHRDRSAG